ncbi:MAG: DUF1566 domain-containing protein [Candidatus Electrothrix sp. AX5]|nr:DUF1566 domain-containing protein [Candidatus Electrothrix sp. AX5]
MKKKFLSFTLMILFLSSSSVVFGGMKEWLLYLPAILSGAKAPPSGPETPTNNPWLLFLPPILSAARSTPPVVVIDSVPRMNDTGIVDCAGDTEKEDCNYGRDVTVTEPNPADGYEGFSFTKLDSTGVALADQTVSYPNTPWSCVKDNTTGLIWEVKTADNKDLTYSWYNSDAETNGGSVGDENNGANTEAYVTAVNTAGLCGATDWRMPTVKELLSLVSLQSTGNTIDTDYFPNNSGIFWTGTPSDHSSSNETAWGVSFSMGNADYFLYKTGVYHIRLVRQGDK